MRLTDTMSCLKMSSRFEDFIDKLKENGYEKEITDKELNELIREHISEKEYYANTFKQEMVALNHIKQIGKGVWSIK